MDHIVNNNWSIATRRFELKGVVYEIIGSESYGKRAMDTIDTIKNLETGKLKKFKRIKLFNYTRKNGNQR